MCEPEIVDLESGPIEDEEEGRLGAVWAGHPLQMIGSHRFLERMVQSTTKMKYWARSQPHHRRGKKVK